ncbi:hypothetical protein [Massilia sp. BJB1822]|uniref:hypothetical protein n=1 Tax=Massilia sp. BJB1822 TaxID=2744470 RepID=UPI001594D0DC|nr:hypothetical protein [Massilia sp. BJB1822]NVE01787.1 hypothetical protein [Massilia sp. BJB1822]
MSDYYVWLEYYADAPVSRNVKSNELKYFTGHKHGAQPTQEQVDKLQSSLTDNVTEAYEDYNDKHPANPATAPTDDAITQARVVKTRSAY